MPEKPAKFKMPKKQTVFKDPPREPSPPPKEPTPPPKEPTPPPPREPTPPQPIKEPIPAEEVPLIQFEDPEPQIPKR